MISCAPFRPPEGAQRHMVHSWLRRRGAGVNPAATTPVIPLGRNWWEIYLLALCVLSGVGTLVSPPSLLPNLERALPPLILTAWSWCLIVGGAIALAGTLIRPGALSMLIERSGLLILAGACVSYPLALLMSSGIHALDRVVTILLFGWVVLGRIVVITRVVRALSRSAS